MRLTTLLALMLGIVAITARADAAEPLREFEVRDHMFHFHLLPQDAGIRLTLRDSRPDFDWQGKLTQNRAQEDSFRTMARSEDGRVAINNVQCRGLSPVVWDVESNKIIGRPGEDAPLSRMIGFTKPDGSEAAILGREHIHLVKIPTFEPVANYAAPPAEKLWSHGFHRLHDGRLVALYAVNTNYQGEPGSALLWDVKGEKPIRTVALDQSPRKLSLSPDGRWLIATTRHREGKKSIEHMRVFDLTDKEQPWDLGRSLNVSPRVWFSRGGGLVAVFKTNGRLDIYDVASREPVFGKRFRSKYLMPCRVCFSPNEEKIYVGYNQDAQRDGKQVRVARVVEYALPKGTVSTTADAN